MPTWSAYLLLLRTDLRISYVPSELGIRGEAGSTYERYWIQSEGSRLKWSLSRNRSSKFQLICSASLGASFLGEKKNYIVSLLVSLYRGISRNTGHR